MISEHNSAVTNRRRFVLSEVSAAYGLTAAYESACIFSTLDDLRRLGSGDVFEEGAGI